MIICYNIIYDNKLYVRGASETAGVNGDALEYTLNKNLNYNLTLL